MECFIYWIICDRPMYRSLLAKNLIIYIYGLHAFQKKSPKGIKIAQKDIDLIKQRYKQAVEQSKREK